MKKLFNRKNKKGFTLIEMVIAVGLFSIVMLVALAIILSVVDNNKKVHSVNVVVDNLNFAIDSMVRDIKTGKYYRCGYGMSIDVGDTSSCDNPPTDVVTLISTLYDNNKIVQYRYLVADANHSYGRIVKQSCLFTSIGDTRSCVVGTDSVEESDLTSSEIDITGVTFVVRPGVPSSAQPALQPSQPTVFLLIKGTSAINPTEASDFTIQTLISQRYLNI